jgi:hypothetical protein
MNGEIMFRLPWAAHAAFFNLRRFSSRRRAHKSLMSEAKENVKQTQESSVQRERLGLRKAARLRKSSKLKGRQLFLLADKSSLRDSPNTLKKY